MEESGTGLEIELKAGVRPADLARLASALAGRTGSRPRPDRLVTRYFDSPDGRLAASGIALRLRESRGRRHLSVKAGRQSLGGFQQAQETEVAQRGRVPELERLPAALRTAIAGRLAGASLEARFETRIRREIYEIAEPDGIVEVALDRGSIRAGSATEPVAEVEFELVGGSPEALFRLARALLAPVPARLGLPNKAERGAALARGEPLPALGLAASRPAGPALDRAGLERQLATLALAVAANLHATLVAVDPEGPHQLRVALRRLRAFLALHRPLLDQDLARRLAREARDLGRCVAPLRDADVLRAGPLAAGASTALGEALARWHEGTRRRARRALLARGATGLAVELLGHAALGSLLRSALPEALWPARLARRIDRHWRRVEALGNRLAALDPEARHELRKALKKLRYMLELLAVERTPFLEGLKRLQEALGELNDLAMLRALEPPVAEPALAAEFQALVRAALAGGRSRADQLMGRACRHWQALSRRPRPWESPRAPARLRR